MLQSQHSARHRTTVAEHAMRREDGLELERNELLQGSSGGSAHYTALPSSSGREISGSSARPGQPGRFSGFCRLSYATLAKASALLTLIALAITAYNMISFKQVAAWVKYYSQHRGEALPLFLLLNAALVVLFCPGAIPQLLAGAVFGLQLGLPAAWVGTTVGQTAAFLLGRYLFRNSLASYLERHYPKLGAVESAIFNDGKPWKLLLLLRVAPIFPDSLLNYSLSVTSVSLVLFTWVSALALLPYSLLYVYLGSASGDIIDTLRGKGEKTPAERTRQVAITAVSAAFGVLALVYVVVVVRRAFAKVLARAEAAEAAGGGDLELQREAEEVEGQPGPGLGLGLGLGAPGGGAPPGLGPGLGGKGKGGSGSRGVLVVDSDLEEVALEVGEGGGGERQGLLGSARGLGGGRGRADDGL